MSTTLTANNYIGLVLDDKYRLTSLLGQGGMGAVYCGEHLVLKKKVAIKFLQQGFAMTDQLIKRFYREAQAAAAIGHEGIIDVMDVGTAPSGEPYLVMEYLEGESLGQLLSRSAPLSIPAACAVMAPSLRALHAAHTKGIVHRDLKPENIFLCYSNGKSPRIKLIDFGISKIMAAPENEKLTQTGSIIGTPAYMSPEQARGNSAVDHRTDLFSMGVIFYQMVTGKLPFSGDSATDILVKIITGDPVPAAAVVSDFPDSAASIIAITLAKDAGQRYSDALGLLAAIEKLPGYADGQTELEGFCSNVANATYASEAPLSVAASAIGNGRISPDGVDTGGTAASAWTQEGTRQAVKSAEERKKGGTMVVLLLTIAILLIGGGGVAFWMLAKWNSGPEQAPERLDVNAESKVIGTREILIATKPGGAAVLIDGAIVGDTPIKVTVNRNTNVLIKKDGFAPQAVMLSPTSDPNLIVALIPVTGDDPSGERAVTANEETLNEGDSQKLANSEATQPLVAPEKGSGKPQKTPSLRSVARQAMPVADAAIPENSAARIASPPAGSSDKENETQSISRPPPAAPDAVVTAPVKEPVGDPRQKRSSYDNMRELKADYRAGVVTKAEYKVHQLHIRSLRQVEYDAQKKLYREGQITKAEYKYRIEQIRLKYEGLL